MILSGEKKEEYREIKGYWMKRLFDKEGEPIRFDIVRFKNGYGKNSPVMDVAYKGVDIKEPIGKWSGNAKGRHYAIYLGNILSTSNLNAATAQCGRLDMGIEEKAYQHLLYRSEDYRDFIEFLSDHYMTQGEFDEMWNKFKEWKDKGMPSAITKP